jgi:hypothetical protein
MSQASQTPTTSLPTFSSLTASRPRRPARKQTELARAFATLQAHLRAFEQPYEPRYEAGPEHLADWADHLDTLLEANRQYVRAVVDQLQQVTPGGLDLDEQTRGLSDANSDLVGALRKAATRAAEAADLAA